MIFLVSTYAIFVFGFNFKLVLSIFTLISVNKRVYYMMSKTFSEDLIKVLGPEENFH